jgi:glucose/arabinose dehydrogenase
LKPRCGPGIVPVSFSNGTPDSDPQDVLTGSVDGDDAHGRPGGLAIDSRGVLLVAADVGGMV